MLFNSYLYAVFFLPCVIAAFYLVGRYFPGKSPLAVLAAGSIIFYGAWRPDHLIIILASVTCNYGLGRLIARQTEFRKIWLYLGVSFNLVLLGVFKYSGFIFHEITRIAVPEYDSAFLGFALPLGISFYSFQQISYLVDQYRRDAGQPGPLAYLSYVMFFPQLVAGPIVYYRNFFPNLKNRFFGRFSWERLWTGCVLFSFGLAKKVMLADVLARYADRAFDAVQAGAVLDPYAAWLGALAYSVQIYFDFSGYSDMALGVGCMFGIRLPINFDSPYQARSVIAFWRRWHISLSSFVKNYLYIPLGGSLEGTRAKYFNLFSVMLLVGLWHGAGYTFIAWGLIHGILLIINHLWRAFAPRLRPGMANKPPLFALLPWAITYFCVVLAWVFFRADSLGSAFGILSSMFGLSAGAKPLAFTGQECLIILLTSLVAFLGPNSQQLLLRHRPTITRIRKYSFAPKAVYTLANDYSLSVAGLALLTVSLLSLWSPTTFIYFIF